MYVRTSPTWGAGQLVVGATEPMSSMMSFALRAIPSSWLVPIGASEPAALPDVDVPWPDGQNPLFTLSLWASGSPPVHGSIPLYGLIGMYRTSFRRVRSVVLYMESGPIVPVVSPGCPLWIWA